MTNRYQRILDAALEVERTAYELDAVRARWKAWAIWAFTIILLQNGTLLFFYLWG